MVLYHPGVGVSMTSRCLLTPYIFLGACRVWLVVQLQFLPVEVVFYTYIILSVTTTVQGKCRGSPARLKESDGRSMVD